MAKENWLQKQVKKVLEERRACLPEALMRQGSRWGWGGLVGPGGGEGRQWYIWRGRTTVVQKGSVLWYWNLVGEGKAMKVLRSNPDVLVLFTVCFPSRSMPYTGQRQLLFVIVHRQLNISGQRGNFCEFITLVEYNDAFGG